MTNHIPSPRPDPEDRWNALTDELADCLPEIGENMCFILAHRAVNHYVQVAGSDNGDLRLEAASNTYIEPPSALLTVAQYRRMRQLGWQGATEHPPELAVEPPSVHGSPNFFRNVDGSRVDHAAEARLLVDTLRLVYGVADPDDLEYDCFHNLLGGVSFEGLSAVRRRPRTPGVT